MSDHRVLKSIPETIAAAVNPDCWFCGGEGWVCENHGDRPWGGISTRADACDCGAGMPCHCTDMDGRPD